MPIFIWSASSSSSGQLLYRLVSSLFFLCAHTSQFIIAHDKDPVFSFWWNKHARTHTHTMYAHTHTHTHACTHVCTHTHTHLLIEVAYKSAFEAFCTSELTGWMQDFCIYTWPSGDVCWLCSALIQSNADHGLCSSAWHPCSGSMADKWHVWRTGDVKLLILYVLEVCETSDAFGAVVMSNYWVCMFWKCLRQVTRLEQWWCQTAESHSEHCFPAPSSKLCQI